MLRLRGRKGCKGGVVQQSPPGREEVQHGRALLRAGGPFDRSGGGDVVVSRFSFSFSFSFKLNNNGGADQAAPFLLGVGARRHRRRRRRPGSPSGARQPLRGPGLGGERAGPRSSSSCGEQ